MSEEKSATGENHFPARQQKGKPLMLGEKLAVKPAGPLKQPGTPFVARAKSRPLIPGNEPARVFSGEQNAPVTEAGLPTSPEASEAKTRASMPDFHPRKWIRQTLRRRTVLGWTLAAFLPAAAVVAWAFFSFGASSQRSAMLAEIARQGVAIPEDFQARLDKALLELRTGDAKKALAQLAQLEKEIPAVSSLTYLVALAAMQAGDPEIASAKAGQSIAKRERVSDSLALKAVLETQNAGRAAKFGDPRLRAEEYLRQAMIADAANPAPCIELATLLRYQRRDKEAMQLLQAAHSRLNPVDSHTVVDATIALLNLQNLPDSEIPTGINPEKDAASVFSAAYAAMRGGDFTRAATFLAAARKQLPADLYFYLVNDPAIRKFVRQPEIAEFFQ
ncbi:MAG: hypothetical protein WCS31_10120 [Verrucomicrobiae bacterium]